MLQWMGGSRRKVTASRKSTHKRQKQYFEQKRRRQHTAGLENSIEGTDMCVQYHEMPKSLDVRSLLNLATDAGECHSNCVNESAAVRMVPVNCQLPRETSLVSVTETRASDSPMDNLPLKKVLGSETNKSSSSYNHASIKDDEKSASCKAATEHHTCSELPFLDLLGDDGSDGNSDRTPVCEAHVAFSVEGLGKMGMETPVHSPQPPSRTCPSPRKAGQRHYLSNRYMMDDLQLELNSAGHNFDIPLGESSLKLPIHSRGMRDPFNNETSANVTNCMPPDRYGFQIDNVLTREGCLDDIWEDKNENPWNGGSVFETEDFFDERKSDVPRKNQPCPFGCSSKDFVRDTTYERHDFAFEDSSILNKRGAKKGPREFEASEPHARSFKHLTGKEHDFITMDGASYPKVNGSSDFTQPTWSFGTEDIEDNMSLLSEESSSSTAVRGEKAKHAASNSTERSCGLRAHGSYFCRSENQIYNSKNIHAEAAEETGYRDKEFYLDGSYFCRSGEKISNLENLHAVAAEETWHRDKEIYLEENEKGSGNKNTRVPNLSRSKSAVHHPNGFSDIKPRHGWLFEEEYTSIDAESGLSPFYKASAESNLTSMDCKFGSENLFNTYPVTKFSTDRLSFHKKPGADTPVKHPFHFGSGTDLFEEPCSPVHCNTHISSISDSMSRKRDTPQVSRTEGEPPYSSHCTKLSTDRHSFEKRSRADTPIKHAVQFGFEELCPVHCDQHISSISESMPRKPETPQVSRTEVEPPYSSHCKNVCADKKSFDKRSKTDTLAKRALDFGFGNDSFEEQCSPVHCDPRLSPISELMSRKRETPQASRTEAEPPSSSSHRTDSSVETGLSELSGQENMGTYSEDKLELQLNDSEKFQALEKEVSVGTNFMLSEYKTTVDVANHKDKYRKCSEAEEETPELKEKLEPRDSPDNTEEPMKDISGKLHLINDKKCMFDVQVPFPSQSVGEAGKNNIKSEKRNVDSSKTSSYTVMLESYVLQLLCVQKVSRIDVED